MKNKLKLLDQVRQEIRLRHYSIRTEQAYVSWIRRYIFFHGKRHPKEMGKKEIETFLSHLAEQRKVAASTQNQAFNALIFLYSQVLKLEVGEGIDAVRAKLPQRLPNVLSKEQVVKVLGSMNGEHQLMAKIMYGCGLRLMECLRLRVKDIDFELNQIVVRSGKGAKDRITVFPDGIKAPLKEHLCYVKKIHDNDLSKNLGRVYLPYALARKYPAADRQWAWQ